MLLFLTKIIMIIPRMQNELLRALPITDDIEKAYQKGYAADNKLKLLQVFLLYAPKHHQKSPVTG